MPSELPSGYSGIRIYLIDGKKIRELQTIKLQKNILNFFYNSSIEKRESYILLDIVQSNYSFLNTIEKSINLPLFEIEKEIKVIVPTINSYTGDKLSAFDLYPISWTPRKFAIIIK